MLSDGVDPIITDTDGDFEIDGCVDPVIAEDFEIGDYADAVIAEDFAKIDLNDTSAWENEQSEQPGPFMTSNQAGTEPNHDP